MLKHKAEQATVKLKNRTVWRDLDLVFARDMRPHIGWPITSSNLGKVWLDVLAAKAGLGHLRVLDIRHMSASLLFARGESLEVISKR